MNPSKRLEEVVKEFSSLGPTSLSNAQIYIYLKTEMAERLNEEFERQYAPKGGYFVGVVLKETDEKLGPLIKYKLEITPLQNVPIILPSAENDRILLSLPRVLKNFKKKSH